MDPRLLHRYSSVVAREAGGSTPGERAAASSVRAAMEAQYPGIREAAAAAQRAAQVPPPAAGPLGWGDIGEKAAEWADLFGDILGTAAKVRRAQRLAETYAEVDAKVTRTGTLTITLRLHEDSLDDVLERCAGPDLQVFASAVGEQVARVLMETLVDEDADAEEEPSPPARARRR